MSNPQGPTTPAGWYRDPAGSDQLRWWDGASWTAHLAPVPVPQPAPAFVPAPTPTITQAPVIGPADATEQPYVPFQNSWSSGGGYGTGSGDFARPAQWNTVGVWLIATSQFWAGALGLILGFGVAYLLTLDHISLVPGSTGYAALELGAGTLVLVLLLLAAARDRARLAKLGYLRSTSIWWLLILPFTPLAYLIARTVRVRSESGRGAAPLVFFIVSYVVLIILGVAAAVAIPLFLATHDTATSKATETANATSLATGITSGMEQNGGSYTVNCTPFAQPKTSPVEVTCIAVDLKSHESHTLQIEVDPGVGGGQPTVKLLSVNPPINQ